MTTLKSRLQKNAFLFSLENTYPKSFDEILEKVKKYANAKEAYDMHLILIEPRMDQKLESLVLALPIRATKGIDENPAVLHLTSDLGFHREISKIDLHLGDEIFHPRGITPITHL